jgi:serine/threonine protein kinase
MIIEAVAYCHEKNIIHRDIKLQNVLIKYNNERVEFKISDFGFACYDLSDGFHYDKNSIICKKYHKLCGTPYYMAPEIVINMNNKNKEKYCYNKVIDTWSFGICLYELIFGGFPFVDIHSLDDLKIFYESDEVQESIDVKVIRREIITDDFKNILLGMLRVDDAKRYNIYDIIKEFDELECIYIETDLEKEIADIINSEEHAYLNVKHQFLTESDYEMSWQCI